MCFVQFPHIVSSSISQIKHKGMNSQTRTLKDTGIPKSFGLRLTNCKDAAAKGWSTKFVDHAPEQICWTGNSGGNYPAPFCLNKREFLSSS